MKFRPKAYVCLPHATDRDFPSHRPREYCRALFDLGYMPIAPNVLLSGFTNDKIPEEREERRRMALRLLRGCHVLVLCSNIITEEMESDIVYAKRLGIICTTFEGIKTMAGYEKGAK